jgi:uncharacterized protein (TIGR00369 family)
VGERVTAMIHDAMPFAALLGFEGVEAGPGAVVVRGAWAEERCTAAGVLHGGYLMTLADSAAATLAYLNLPQGATTATIESKTNFLAAVREGRHRAGRARPRGPQDDRRPGRRHRRGRPTRHAHAPDAGRDRRGRRLDSTRWRSTTTSTTRSTSTAS